MSQPPAEHTPAEHTPATLGARDPGARRADADRADRLGAADRAEGAEPDDATLLARVRDELGVPAPLLRAAEVQARRGRTSVGAVLVQMGLLSPDQRRTLSRAATPEATAQQRAARSERPWDVSGRVSEFGSEHHPSAHHDSARPADELPTRRALDRPDEASAEAERSQPPGTSSADSHDPSGNPQTVALPALLPPVLRRRPSAGLPVVVVGTVPGAVAAADGTARYRPAPPAPRTPGGAEGEGQGAGSPPAAVASASATRVEALGGAGPEGVWRHAGATTVDEVLAEPPGRGQALAPDPFRATELAHGPAADPGAPPAEGFAAPTVDALEAMSAKAATSEARARERRRREVLPPLPCGPERYVMGEEIARGGMGRIVAVTDVNLGREVAMKRLIRGPGEQLGLQLRFVEEGQITGQLQHPNIVPVHDLGTTAEGDLFFTMKRVHGHTLREVFRGLRREESPFPERFGRTRLLSGFKQVCMGLAYAHSRGVVHRDLKPSNIMFGDYGEVLIMDWGLAKILAREVEGKISSHREGQARWATRQGEVIGTPGYMPPELALGQLDDVDERADVYSLGAILYEILTLRPPYTGRDARTILGKLLRDPLVPPRERAPGREVPAELEAICLRCLHKDMDRRFPSARAVHDAVEAYLEGALERDRQRDLALEDLTAGCDLAEQHRGLRADAERVALEVAAGAAALPPWAGADRRRPQWEAEARLETLRRAQAETFNRAVQWLRQALTRNPALAEARDALGELYWYAFLYAEEANDFGNMQHYEALLRAVDGPRYDALLRGDGRLAIASDPPGVRAALFRIEHIDHIATPVNPRDLGVTPCLVEPLPMGSYLLVLRSPGLRDTQVPVRIRRLAREQVEVRLRADSHLPRGVVYVPGGRFEVGGDPAASWTLPPQTVTVGDFCLSRLPVSCRQYLDFLNELAQTDAAQARLRVPRLFAQGGPLFVADPHRGYALPARGPGGEPFDPNWPVFGISRLDAEAYCRWRAARDAVAWRLPTELEWEVAARGPDGRRFVWGDTWEPTYCNCAHARPGPPSLEPCGSYPSDRSPYGVLDLAGGVADWTATTAEDGAGAIVRGGAWNQLELHARTASRRVVAPEAVSEAVGFRMACDL